MNRVGVMWATVLFAALSGCEACVDLAEPRAYQCTRGSDAEPCPEGWRCGLEGYCREENAEGAFLCETDGDCADTWRCGLGGECHPRDVAAAYPCESHADCEDGWRCGLEGVCHSPQIATDYRCTSDQHCEGSWRCGPAGRCLDPAEDALRPEADPGVLTAKLVSPLNVSRLPDHLAVSQPYRVMGDGGIAQQLAWVDQDRLIQVQRSWRGIYYPDAGLAFTAQASVTRVPDDAGVRDLTVFNRDAYLLTGDGLYRSRFDGGAPVLLTAATGQNLRVEDSVPSRELVFVFDSAGFYKHEVATGITRGPYALPLSQPYLDLTGIGGYDDGVNTPQKELLYAAGTRGMYMAWDGGTSQTGPAWFPFDLPGFPHQDCGGTFTGASYRVERIYSDENPYLTLQARRWDQLDGGAYLALMSTGSPVAATACRPPNHVLRMGPCAACPAGGTLMEATPGGDRYQKIQVRCRFATDVPERELYLHTDCSFSDAPDTTGMANERTRAQRSRWGQNRGIAIGTFVYIPGGTGFVRGGEHGQLWATWIDTNFSTGPRIDYPQVQPLQLDRVPDRIVEGPVAPTTYLGAYTTASARTQWVPEVGLVQVDANGEDPVPAELPLAPVAGSGGWRLMPGSTSAWVRPTVVDPQRGPDVPLAVATEFLPLEGPYRAQSTRTPDGGTLVVVSAFDSLMGADVTAGLSDGSVAPLEVKAIPRSRTAILSIATLPPATQDGGNTPLVRGYALTQSGLYTFEASAPTRWSTSSFPVPDGAWLSVWMDGARGRLGYADGTVVALPSRVRLAEPVPGVRFFEFAQLCGQPFALTSSGVLRLVLPDGAAVGQWVPEPLPGFPGQGVDSSLEGGRIFVQNNAVFVFTRYGTVLKLASGVCAN